MMQCVENVNIVFGIRSEVLYEIINILDRNCFGIYIIHQFILNLLGLYGRGFFYGFNIYAILSILGVATFVGALVLSELYNTAIRFIKKSHEN